MSRRTEPFRRPVREQSVSGAYVPSLSGLRISAVAPPASVHRRVPTGMITGDESNEGEESDFDDDSDFE